MSKTWQNCVQGVDRDTGEADGHIGHSWSAHGPEQSSLFVYSWSLAPCTNVLLSHLVGGTSNTQWKVFC